jgi:hypothetical protein
MTEKYILNKQGEPVVEPQLMKWATWFEDSIRTRRVARDAITADIFVSTVFLGFDHGWGDGPPVLWETMVFGGPMDQEQDRCSGSREQALAMHERMVQRVKEKIEKD